MFEVGITAQFEAAHALRGDFGPATRRHGHTYSVEVRVRGAALQPGGTLLDIGSLRTAVSQAVGDLDYQDLDNLEPFRERNSTAEEVARYLWERVAPVLTGGNLDSLSVKVAESPTAFARYDAKLT